ncbi:MAG TPA: ABC transporter permease [Thermoleophilaceae bacterium]|nr:ABC transporter permease [Thermoleophilaceae bacterium]
MTALAHTRYMTATHLRQLWRQPWWIAVSLVQPVIWLLLFGALFQSVADLPGFGSDDYIVFLAPGIVIMTAFFSAGWTGMGLLEDLDRGVTDRLLASPISRPALMAGRVAQQTITMIIQSLIMVGIALLAGASFANGVLGVAGLIAIAALISAAFASLSLAFALVARKEETLIATLTFLQLPLSFISSTLMRPELMPGWMESLANFNPVEWAVEAGRAAALGEGGFDIVVTRAGLLAGFAAVGAWLALKALEKYQRSL